MIRRLPPSPPCSRRRARCSVPSTGSSAPVANVATSQAFAIRVVVPGQAARHRGLRRRRPNDSVGTDGGFAYPSDGSVLTSGSIALERVGRRLRRRRSPRRRAEVNGISLFGGEVTVARVDAKVNATARTTTSGDGRLHRHGGQRDRRVGASPGSALGDWGRSRSARGRARARTASGAHGWHGSVDGARHQAHRRPRRATRRNRDPRRLRGRERRAPTRRSPTPGRRPPSQEPFNAKSGSATSAPRRSRRSSR